MIDMIVQHIAVLEQQVDALKSQLLVLKGMISILTPVPEGDPPECGHEQVIDQGSTFGNPKFRCLQCGEPVEGPPGIRES